VKLAIAQDFEYIGNDYWRWSAWIEGKPSDLDAIEKVTWFLHPSFAQSIVVSRERGTGFRLESSGWGTFTLRAEAHCVDGSVQTLRQPLKLFYPDAKIPAPRKPVRQRLPSVDLAETFGDDAGRGVRKVFLSFASSDRSRASALRGALEKAGMTVFDDSTISADQPIELAILDLLTRADATVAFVSSEVPSAFVAQEISTSARSGKPTLVVTSEELGPIAGVPSDVRVIKFDPSDAGSIAAAISGLAITGSG
jgi:hypothetical protein